MDKYNEEFLLNCLADGNDPSSSRNVLALLSSIFGSIGNSGGIKDIVTSILKSNDCLTKYDVRNFADCDLYEYLLSATKIVDIAPYFTDLQIGGTKSVVISEILGVGWVGDDFEIEYNDTLHGTLFHCEICKGENVTVKDFDISTNPFVLMTEAITADNLDVCFKIVLTRLA